MQYNGFSILMALLALLTLFIAARILFDRHWILGWLRGTCGLLFLALALLVAWLAYDFSRFTPIEVGKPLFTLEFKRSNNLWQVAIEEQGSSRKVTLAGDLWQADVRLLSWKGLAGLIGLQPGYRLQRLNARFLDKEQQTQAQYSRVELAGSPYTVDLWRWLALGEYNLFLLDAQARRLSYQPMVDGALFSLNMTAKGLRITPLNHAAQQAVQR